MAKTVSTLLKAHVAQEVTTLAYCWKIVRTDGVTFTFTSHDTDLTIGDEVYSSSAGFQNSAIESKSDMTVDNMEVVGIFDDASITIADLRAGLFDYADVFMFVVNWQDTTMGDIKMRRGKLGECVATPQGFFNVELRGLTQLLSQQIVELYGPACRADLFDSRCGLNAADYQCTGHVTTVTNQTHFVIALDSTAVNYTAEDGWFQFGVLTWTSGASTGRAVEVKTWNHTSGALEIYLPTGYPTVVNDAFNIVPGCDKSLGACKDKFNNLNNMRAESHLPGNDQVFNYPDVGGGS